MSDSPLSRKRNESNSTATGIIESFYTPPVTLRRRDRRHHQPSEEGAYRATALAALIGDKVRASREAASLTQKELAERVGCSRSEIANIEAGSVAATVSMLACIADSLGLTLNVGLHRTSE